MYKKCILTLLNIQWIILPMQLTMTNIQMVYSCDIKPNIHSANTSCVISNSSPCHAVFTEKPVMFAILDRNHTGIIFHVAVIITMMQKSKTHLTVSNSKKLSTLSGNLIAASLRQTHVMHLARLPDYFYFLSQRSQTYLISQT